MTPLTIPKIPLLSLFLLAILIFQTATYSLSAQETSIQEATTDRVDETISNISEGKTLYSEVDLRILKESLAELRGKNRKITTFQSDFKEYSTSLKQGKIYINRPDQLKLEYYLGKNLETEIFNSSNKVFMHFVTKKIVYEQQLRGQKKLAEKKKDEKLEKEMEGEVVNRVHMFSFDYFDEYYNFNFGESISLVELFSEEEKKKFNLPSKFSKLVTHYLLTPKDITLQLDHLELWFDEEGRINRVKATNIKDEEIDIYFYNFRDKKLADRFFDLTIPANARLIKNMIPEFNISEPEDDL